MRDKIREFAIDVVAVIGAGILVYGLGIAWRPLGFIAAGAVLILGALALGTRRIG
jgi:hypothetical protein